MALNQSSTPQSIQCLSQSTPKTLFSLQPWPQELFFLIRSSLFFQLTFPTNFTNPIQWVAFDGWPNKITDVAVIEWMSFFSSSYRWGTQVQRDETFLLKAPPLGRRQTWGYTQSLVFFCCVGMPWTSVSKYILPQRTELFPGPLWLKEVMLSECHWNSESKGALYGRWFSQPLIFIFFPWEPSADFRSPLGSL